MEFLYNNPWMPFAIAAAFVLALVAPIRKRWQR